MKTLTIFFSDTNSIVTEDDDDRNIEEYISELSKVLESNNIALLHTSSSSIIIRPNAISAVIVSDTDETPKEPKTKIQKPSLEKEKKSKKESDKPQDIISD
jgi:hypothetical protein